MISHNNQKDVNLRNHDPSQLSPLVIMISWTRAKKRHLLKYSQIYEKKGCTVILITCNFYESVCSHENLFAVKTEKVVEIIRSQICKYHQRKVFFHLFSFPGPVMFINLMNYYHKFLANEFGTNKYMKPEEEVVLNIVGVVYDSCCVAKVSAKQFGEIFKSVPNSKMKQEIIDHFCRCLYKIVRPSKRYRHWNFWDEVIKNIPGGYSQLFLTSDNDPVITLSQAEDFVSYRKTCGDDIKYHVFENSNHVSHLRRHPDQYKFLIGKFIEENLRQHFEVYF